MHLIGWRSKPRERKDVDAFVAQCLYVVVGGLSPNRTLRFFLVMNGAGFFRKILANVLAVFHHEFDELAVQSLQVPAGNRDETVSREQTAVIMTQ